MTLSSEQCFAKLEELRKWQENQQQILIENQQSQMSKTLLKLQNKKYSMQTINEMDHSEVKKQHSDELDNHKPPKPFLKRGEGLKNRFKIHPDTFKLDNLPKYKFANKKVFRKPQKCIPFKENKVTSMQKQDEPEMPESKSDILFDCDKNTWKNILVDSQCDNMNESEDLNLFELLEKKIDNSSFCSNASSIIRLLTQHKDQLNYNNDSIVETSNVENDKLIVENDFESDLLSDNSNDSSIHVRFSDKVTINEVDSISLTDSESVCEEQLNSVIIANEESKDGNDYTEDMTILFEKLLKTKQIEIEERNELLKVRLGKLEEEIEIFQRQNLVLTKMKQDYELYKIEMENKFKRKKDEIEHEKVKIETYLNNEKSKLTEERTKLEKRLNELKNPSKKEREEINKLKITITELQQQTKLKESRLSSSQTRLRAQIRSLENQIKERDVEIETLKKNNKKLDSENVRLRRQNNNKMLLEINKNISKLVPVIEVQQPKIPKELHTNKKRNESCIKQSFSSDSESDDIINSHVSTNSEDEEENNTNSTKQKNLLLHEEESINSSNTNDNNNRSTESTNSLKREIQNLDGTKDIWYPNGNIKKISSDGFIIKMLYYNKDIKETNINEGTIKYYYAETNIWHTTYLDGLEIFEFPSGLTEHRYKDGKIESHYPNGSICISNQNNTELEEWQYPDGTIVKIKNNGDKILTLANGQREIHTIENKRREYPDGTVKILYPDGSQETRYSNGRVRLKDKDCNLLMDSDTITNR